MTIPIQIIEDGPRHRKVSSHDDVLGKALERNDAIEDQVEDDVDAVHDDESGVEKEDPSVEDDADEEELEDHENDLQRQDQFVCVRAHFVCFTTPPSYFFLFLIQF